MLTIENQTIVVPYDFSAPSQNAVNQVLNWASPSNVIHLIHVVEPMPLIGIDSPVWIQPGFDIENRDNSLENMKQRFTPEIRSRVNFHCNIGSPGSEIVALAEKEKADLIVMPSHGRSGLSRWLLGSVAERVLRLSHCHVLVLRGPQFESDDADVKADTDRSAS